MQVPNGYHDEILDGKDGLAVEQIAKEGDDKDFLQGKKDLPH